MEINYVQFQNFISDLAWCLDCVLVDWRLAPFELVTKRLSATPNGTIHYQSTNSRFGYVRID